MIFFVLRLHGKNVKEAVKVDRIKRVGKKLMPKS